VVSGLAYAAEKGITHRDLKMSNVLITSTGRARLVDFGLAAARGTTDEELADSPNARAIDYAALERGTGVRKDDPRSDIYFAGCILYNMLTGTPPLFETRDRIKRLSVTRFHDVKPIADFDLEVPHYLINIVSKAMDLNPENRFQNPTEMVLELKLAAERIKRGDEGAAAEVTGLPHNNVPKEGDGKGSSLSAALEGASRTVMIVESNMEMQDALRERLKRRGYRVLVISDPERALNRFEDEKVADAVVFCTSELGRGALEAFNRFGENERTKSIPAILLADQRQRFIIEDARLAEHRVLMAMPLKVRELRQKLIQLFQMQEA
jgi:serine/threonine-protein kinase